MREMTLWNTNLLIWEKKMEIKDNSSYSKETFLDAYPLLSEKIMDKTLSELQESENFFLFPESIQKSEDLEKDSKIVESVGSKINFQNIIGFIGRGDERLTIQSRFSKGDKFYFLHYMLEKIFHLNIVNMETGFSPEEQLYQLLVCLFPVYLNNALRKGAYKEYRKFQHNDTHVKGTIDISRHIKKNIPFRGTIAYDTREFTANNEVMHLIRHTIEWIRSFYTYSPQILGRDLITKQTIQTVIEATPNYSFGDRKQLLHVGKTKPIRHAYYTEYGILQKLCIFLLSQKNMVFPLQIILFMEFSLTSLGFGKRM